MKSLRLIIAISGLCAVSLGIWLTCMYSVRPTHKEDVERIQAVLKAANDIGDIARQWDAYEGNRGTMAKMTGWLYGCRTDDDWDVWMHKNVASVVSRFHDPKDLAALARICGKFGEEPVFEWSEGECLDRLAEQTSSQAVAELHMLLPGTEGGERVGIEEHIWQQDHKIAQMKQSSSMVSPLQHTPRR